MSALRMLRAEHQTIIRMIAVNDELARRLEQGQSVPPDAIGTVMQFFSLFAYRLHRDKEEELLFPALRDKGLHEGPGCIGALLAQHEEGQAAFQEMIDYAAALGQGDPAAGRAWALAARRYAEIFRQHIRREEEVLFMNAERVLSNADQNALAAEFRKIDERGERAGVAELLRECERVAAEISA